MRLSALNDSGGHTWRRTRSTAEEIWTADVPDTCHVFITHEDGEGFQTMSDMIELTAGMATVVVQYVDNTAELYLCSNDGPKGRIA